MPFIGQKMFERGEEKRAELAALPVGPRQVIPSQKTGEEFLRQILRVFRAVALAPHVGVEGIPVVATKSFQRFPSSWRRALSSGQDDAPVSRAERGGAS